MPRVADRRAKIDLLRAAEEVFAEHGLSASRVEDITTRAGVSKGAFYLHFESKEDCFRQIVEGVLARLAATAEVPDRLERMRTADDLASMFEEALAHDIEVLELCWQNRGVLRMILTGGGGAPYAYLMDAFAERVVTRSEGWMRRGIEIGLYRPDIDPVIVARLVSGIYERSVREIIRQPRRPDIAAWARQMQQLFTAGLFSPRVSANLDRKVSLPRTQQDAPEPGVDAGVREKKDARAPRPRRGRRKDPALDA
jgi:AcrR family transcriptional regulator